MKRHAYNSVRAMCPAAAGPKLQLLFETPVIVRVYLFRGPDRVRHPGNSFRNVPEWHCDAVLRLRSGARDVRHSDRRHPLSTEARNRRPSAPGKSSGAVAGVVACATCAS